MLSKWVPSSLNNGLNNTSVCYGDRALTDLTLNGALDDILE